LPQPISFFIPSSFPFSFLFFLSFFHLPSFLLHFSRSFAVYLNSLLCFHASSSAFGMLMPLGRASWSSGRLTWWFYLTLEERWAHFSFHALLSFIFFCLFLFLFFSNSSISTGQICQTQWFLSFKMDITKQMR
jgi:hypothetical protein